jgi:alpha-mannosidase
MNTQTKGIPVIIFNPLNIGRENVVEASVEFPHGMQKAVHVTAPDGKNVPAQISGGKVILVARLPSVGYAVCDVQPADGPAASSSSLQLLTGELKSSKPYSQPFMWAPFVLHGE